MAKPLPPLKVTVAVAGALEVPCEFRAVYWKDTVAVAVPLGAVVGTAVNEPSGFRVTVPPLALPSTAVSGWPCGSVSLDSTPGGAICSCEAMLLVKVSAFAVGAAPRQAPVHGEIVTVVQSAGVVRLLPPLPQYANEPPAVVPV